MPNQGAIVLNVYSSPAVLSRLAPVRRREWRDSFRSDLQIFAASLIIICLFGDAARFRCGIS